MCVRNMARPVGWSEREGACLWLPYAYEKGKPDRPA